MSAFDLDPFMQMMFQRYGVELDRVGMLDGIYYCNCGAIFVPDHDTLHWYPDRYVYMGGSDWTPDMAGQASCACATVPHEVPIGDEGALLVLPAPRKSQVRADPLVQALRDIREIAEDHLDYDTHALHAIMHILDRRAVKDATDGKA